jgi:hypothetical protein
MEKSKSNVATGTLNKSSNRQQNILPSHNITTPHHVLGRISHSPTHRHTRLGSQCWHGMVPAQTHHRRQPLALWYSQLPIKLRREVVNANAAQPKLVIHVLVHPTLGISIRNSGCQTSARGTTPTSRQAPHLQPGSKRRDMLSVDAAPSRHVAFVSWQIPWQIQWQKLAFFNLVNSKLASSRRSKFEN